MTVKDVKAWGKSHIRSTGIEPVNGDITKDGCYEVLS